MVMYFANGDFATVTGYRREYLIGKKWANYVTFDLVKFTKAQKFNFYTHANTRVFHDIRNA